jgi:hypothetical protein
MKTFRNLALALSLFMSLALPSACFATPTASSWFTIYTVSTDQSSDTLIITPDSPHTVVNPSSCSLTYGYAMSSDVAGHSERYAMLLGALLSNKEVYVVVDGCASGLPKVISVSIRRQ